jgi:type VI secretion system secreted protein Hcp
MAFDCFLKLGDIKGEARDHAHPDEIDVLAWSWGMAQSGTMSLGGGGGSGKVNIQDLSVTKFVDTSTTNLFLKCANGKHYPEALLTVRKAGENPVEYVKITMTDVMISNISTGGSGSEDRVTENVSLNFAKVKVEYTPQNADGSAAATMEMNWDIEANTGG